MNNSLINQPRKSNNINYLIIASSATNIMCLVLGGVILSYVIDISDDAEAIKTDVDYLNDTLHSSILGNKTEMIHYIDEIALLLDRVCKIVKC
tara:strand:+ start:1155 stop:1433 length:279 start_codon:yes stop_codon:yes gene_type:complete